MTRPTNPALTTSMLIVAAWHSVPSWKARAWPAGDIQMVKDTLALMLAGKFTRFDVFSGEIKDNKGNVIVPAGEKFVQADLDQFPPGAEGLACKYCMYWWADGITAE